MGLPVLAWTLPERLAGFPNDEFGTTFVGRRPDEIDVVVEVERARQHRVIGCDASQSSHNPVLWRRLELQRNRETFRWILLPERI